MFAMSRAAPILTYATTSTRINANEVVLTPPPPGWEIGLLSLATFFGGLGTLVAAAAFFKGIYEADRPVMLVGGLALIAAGWATFSFVRGIVRRWRSGHAPWRVWRSDQWLIIDAPALFGPSPKRIARKDVHAVTVRRLGWSTNLRKLYRLRLRKGPRAVLMLSFVAVSPDEAEQIQQRIAEMVMGIEGGSTQIAQQPLVIPT
jgi:hypothetical protein